MPATTRKVTQGVLILLLLLTVVALVNDVLHTKTISFIIADLIAAPLLLVLIWLTRRGWNYAGLVITAFITAAIVMTLDEKQLLKGADLIILVPPALAMLLTSPRWIIISASAIFVSLIVQGGWQSTFLDPFYIMIYSLIIGCFVGVWMITNSAFKNAVCAQVDAEQAAQALQLANENLEQRVTERTAEVQSNLVAIQTQAAEQARLLQENDQQRRTIRELSVPVIPVSDTTMVMPLVGELDTERLDYIHSHALETLERSKAHTLVIDITAVPMVDSQVAQGLMRIAQAARLLGSKVVLVGIRPEVAQTIVGLGLNVSSLTTYSNLQSALK